MSQSLTPISRYELQDYLDHIPEHQEMLEVIARGAAESARAKSFFGKHHSQFMNKMMQTVHITPIRNLRQILAEKEKIELAIKENVIELKKKEVELRSLKREIEEGDLSATQIEMRELDIAKIELGIESSKIYISGAIRSLASYVKDYEDICAYHGIKDFNELDFEAEEERYHITKAFEQALTAARARGGMIDEGNLMYFQQIGINGAAAQQQIRQFLIKEAKYFADNSEPPHKLVLDWLLEMADKYKGSAERYAKWKGLSGTVTEEAALKQGDMRLLGG